MRSFIDSNHPLSADQWVVSLLCKPQASATTGGNPEHAFIVVEGFNESKESGPTRIFRRYDFVTPRAPAGAEDNSKLSLIKQKSGMVLIKEQANSSEDDSENLRFFWVMVMKDIDKEQGCAGASWALSTEVVAQLQHAVEESKKNPPHYQISGQQALFAASFSQAGHNCFTWARHQLLSLGVGSIRQDPRLKLRLKDFLAARTTRHLVPPKKDFDQEPTSLGCSIS